MNQATTSLTFWRITASLSRLLLWLAMAAWGLFAVAWIVLHGVIVPRIGDFRPRLEIEASKALGVPVRIGAIMATSVGIIPSFELKDVTLLDGAGRVALKLPRILAAISPSSLLQLNFEQLFIDQPELEIRRAVDGKIFVAGLDFSKPDSDSSDALDWFFSQPEFVIRNGTLRWVDEQANGAMGVPPPLELSKVDFVSRNPFNKHLIRLDATPPPAWGERFSMRGMFTQSLLSTDKGKWRAWAGQVYADFSKVDVSQLSQYVKFSSQFGRGVGALRVWTSVAKGAWVSSTADVALSQVDATLGTGLEPLALQSMSGRLMGRQIKQGFEFSTQNLQFQTRDGLRWPGGNVFFSQTEPVGTVLGQGELRADKLDLATISLIANRLPLGAATHAKLTSFAPQGVIETIAATWRGNLDAPTAFAAKGQVTGLQFAAQRSTLKTGTGADAHEDIGRPGVRGAKVDFDVNKAGGKARVAIENGAVEVPGIFDDPRVQVNQLSADVQWSVTPPKSSGNTTSEDKIEVKVSNLVLNNADAQGRGQLTWRTSDPATAVSKNRFPGELDLQANLTRADATRVWRYLPSGIPKSARDYVREAVVQGTSSGVDFKIKGDMSDMPSSKPKQGEFRIAAKISNARVAYVPRSLQSKDELPWPELHKLTGELVIDRMSLTVKSTAAEIVGLPNVAISQTSVSIADLKSTTVTVNTQGKGSLAEVLGFVNGSPLKNMTNQVLSHATINGTGDFKLELSLPIADLNRSRVAGNVTFPGNDVHITPTTPLLAQAKGVVSFSEKGFSIQGAQAAMLGGGIRFEGGTVPAVAAAPSSVVIRGQGTATALGLQQAGDLSFIPSLAKHATGSAAYSAELRFKQGQSEVLVQSNLVGMGLTLPAPMNKLATASLPLRYDNTLVENSLQPDRDGKVRPRDQLHVTIDKLAEVKLTRDLSGSEPRVIHGGISVGLDAGESMPEPANGVAANINVAYLDVDQWSNVLTSMMSNGGAAAKPGTKVDAKGAADDYVPSTVALRAKELIVQGRKFENIVIGGSREGATWRANIEARQLSGYVEYRMPTSAVGSGRVYARLARLAVGETQAKEVEQLLDEQPASIPALDLLVEDFELKGRKFGRVEVEAINQAAVAGRGAVGGREWRLNRLNVTLPEAKFSANGHWVDVAHAASEPGTRTAVERRTTSMDFKLDIADSGQLLNRFGLKDVVLGGKGKLEGQIAWRGSPLSMNYPSMTGQFNVNIEKGQFLKVDPGVGKLLSVLSMQSIVKRLTLDFRDVFSDGFAFDFVRGDVSIDRGMASTNNIQMSGVNAVVLIDGKSDIALETQDLRVVIAPEVNAGVASLLVASAINPAIGLGTFLAQLFLRQPLIEAATKELHVKGTWAEPLITEAKRTARSEDKKQ
ncbi:MAG: YhdP family protein [Burkholderiaceae bacterium]|nr:YhdP family protein [Burkholderiaceae bacterium]